MNLYDKLSQLDQTNTPFVLAIVVKSEGSVPGKAGFKILVEQSGKTHGTVGGGAIEKAVIEECLKRMAEGNSGLQEYLLSEKTPASHDGEIPVIPMMCNGRVWIYYDVSRRRTPVYVFGGGHVGQALCAFLTHLNYHLVLIDNREEFANQQANPNAHKCLAQDYIGYVESFEPLAGSFAVIMTHGHHFDYEILKRLFQRKLPFSYIGVIASPSKASQLINNLKKDLGTELDLSMLFTPVGLDIGGSSAAEIALSVAAEMQAIQFKKNVPHLRKGN